MLHWQTTCNARAIVKLGCTTGKDGRRHIVVTRTLQKMRSMSQVMRLRLCLRLRAHARHVQLDTSNLIY